MNVYVTVTFALCRLTMLFSSILLIMLSCQREMISDELQHSKQQYSESPILRLISNRTSEVVVGYFSALPAKYFLTTESYPLILWISGSKQYGDGTYLQLGRLLWGGIPQLLADTSFPNYFQVNGRRFTPIVLSPQFSRAPDVLDIKQFLNFALANYRIDEQRIYVVGISAGGILTCDFASENAEKIAAIVPIAGEPINDGSLVLKCEKLAKYDMPIWVFHNHHDKVVPTVTAINFVRAYNSLNPKIHARITLLPPFGEANHDAWSLAVLPNRKEEGMNIYEWMLKFSRP